jgi:hypothetical protein
VAVVVQALPAVLQVNQEDPVAVQAQVILQDQELQDKELLVRLADFIGAVLAAAAHQPKEEVQDRYIKLDLVLQVQLQDHLLLEQVAGEEEVILQKLVEMAHTVVVVDTVQHQTGATAIIHIHKIQGVDGVLLMHTRLILDRVAEQAATGRLTLDGMDQVMVLPDWLLLDIHLVNMATFKTSYNIFKKPWEEELFDENWMDKDKAFAPPTVNWDYSREMKIEDVEIWEQIYYATSGIGLYAAYLPYAEFYMITGQWIVDNPGRIECFYGPGSMQAAYKRAIELGMPISVNQKWVDDKDLWLFQESAPKADKIILL